MTQQEKINELHLEREQPTLNPSFYYQKNTHQEKELNVTQSQPTLTAVYKVCQNTPFL